jgi:hypothetical protein
VCAHARAHKNYARWSSSVYKEELRENWKVISQQKALIKEALRKITTLRFPPHTNLPDTRNPDTFSGYLDIDTSPEKLRGCCAGEEMSSAIYFFFEVCACVCVRSLRFAQSD